MFDYHGTFFESGPPPERIDLVQAPPSTATLVAHVHRLHREIAERQRAMLGALAELEVRAAWLDDGAPDMTQWTAMQLGISRWKADRWVAAGRALAGLPAIAEAMEHGQLGIDKVVELTRFAEFDDEDALVRWAQGVASGAIRRVGDLGSRERAGEAPRAERDRWLEWRYTEQGSRFALDAELPAAHGAVVARALERLGEQVPVMPYEDSAHFAGTRRADALVALCSARLAEDKDQDRATVVVHADIDALTDADAAALIEGGPVIGGTTVQRLLCNARVQTVVEHPDGSNRPGAALP